MISYKDIAKLSHLHDQFPTVGKEFLLKTTAVLRLFTVSWITTLPIGFPIENRPYEKPPLWKTFPIENLLYEKPPLWKTSPMINFPDRKPPLWKASPMENLWKTSSMKNLPYDKPHLLKTTPMKYLPYRKPPVWKTFLIKNLTYMENHPYEKSPL